LVLLLRRHVSVWQNQAAAAETHEYRAISSRTSFMALFSEAGPMTSQSCKRCRCRPSAWEPSMLKNAQQQLKLGRFAKPAVAAAIVPARRQVCEELRNR
jgi:hypothetical protein